MENFEKGDTVLSPIDHREPFAKVLPLPEDVLVMTVRGGSKIQTLLDVAIQGMSDVAANRRVVVFFGTGPAINKVISCVEILKRRIKEPLQQITKLSYQEVSEMWNPKLEGLNVLKVTRKVPVIHVLLSKDPLDPNEPGFQK